MAFLKIKPLIFLLFLALIAPTTMISCTSSEGENESVLEGELETMGEASDDTESLEDLGDLDELEDLSDLGEDDLSDTFDVEDDELAELDVDLGEDGESGEDEIADEDFSDDELDDVDFEEGGEEFADAGQGGDEFDEFAEFEDGGKKDPFAQDEKALANELNQQGDYPVADNAKAQFPEEVVGKNNPPPFIPPAEGTMGAPMPPVGQPLITSETQEILGDIPDPMVAEAPQDDLGMADPIVPPADSDMPDERNWIPVVKVKEDPFFRNDRLMNTVYIARPDEGLGSISQKIFGEDRKETLLADNPHLAKGVDPGDKVYYNSPNRSEDRTMKVYYDDIGLPPQYYKTKKNDNMRRLGTKLIGFAEGWKEIWAINPDVDSKTILPAGLELKYWTGNESKPTLEVTQEQPATAPEQEVAMEEDVAMGGVEDPFQDAELPPEPPLPEAQVAGLDPTLEPEPVPDIEPFPEEGVEEAPIPPPQPSVQPAESSDSLLAMGAMALLIMAGAGLVAIQIKKRKDATAMSPGSLEYTQV